jgi:hypothetical protein
MAFGRKKGPRELNLFGPMDTLIAASQTLDSGEREMVTEMLLDEAFVNAAIRNFANLPPEEVERFSTLVRLADAYAKYLVRLPSRTDAHEIRESRRVVCDILKCEPDKLEGIKYYNAIGLSFTAMKGGIRMMELRRDDKALAAFAFAIPLIWYACKRSDERAT